MFWNVISESNLRRFAKFLSMFIAKDSKVYTWLKRQVYFRLAANRIIFDQFKTLTYTGKRFYFFKYREIILAIDSGPLNDTRGIGRVTKNLFLEVDEKLAIHSNDKSLEQLLSVKESKVDIYLYPSIQWAEENKLSKSALIIFDILPISFPNLFPDSRIREWKKKYKKFAMKARVIITVSEYSASEITEKIGISKEQLYVVPLGIENKIISSGSNLHNSVSIPYKKYFIFIGSNDYHKNLDIVIKALCDSSLTGCGLVVVGENFTKVQMNTWSNILKNRITFYGYLNDDKTVKLLSGAEALLLPSFSEGFGFPPFEAAIQNIPSICSDRPAMNQVLKGAALFADPTDERDWVFAMNKILRRDSIIFEKLENAKKLTEKYKWKKFLQRLLTILQSSTKSDYRIRSDDSR